MLVLPIFLAAPSMAVVWHTGSGSRMPEGCRDSWYPCTLGMEPQVCRQVPTARQGSDYVREGRLYRQAAGWGE